MSAAPATQAVRAPTGFRPFWAGGLAVAGALAIVGAEGFTRALDRMLPASATVPSVGFPFPSFSVAFPYTLRALGAAAIAAAVAWLFVASVPAARGWRAPRGVVPLVLGALVLAAFAVYAWLSWPHNAGPGDAQIHWVDIFFGRRERFFYVLVKPIHALLYDVPHVAQGLHGATNVLLVFLIGRRVFGAPWVPLALGASVLASGQLLGLADGASDVQLSASALLFAVWMIARRSTWGGGVALFVATLARPPFVLLAGAFVLVELLWPGDEDGGARGLRAAWANRFLVRNVAVFGVLFVAWHAMLRVLGWDWIGANGRLFDVPHFDLEPVAVDGFVASPFSGAYLFHLAWIYPLPLLVSSAVVAVRARRLPRFDRKLFALVWSFVGLSLLTHEALVIKGFSIKYASYYVPLVIVASWLVLRLPAPRRTSGATAALVVLLLAGPAATYTRAFDARAERAAAPIAAAFYDRAELRALASGSDLASTLRATSMRNHLAYVFRRDVTSIRIVEPGVVPAGAVVFTASLDGYEGSRTLWEGRGLYLVGAP